MGYLEVLTSNKVIVGDSRFSDRESFQDIYKLFSVQTNSSSLTKILQKYNITALIMYSKDMDLKNKIHENIKDIWDYNIYEYDNYILFVIEAKQPGEIGPNGSAGEYNGRFGPNRAAKPNC